MKALSLGTIAFLTVAMGSFALHAQGADPSGPAGPSNPSTQAAQAVSAQSSAAASQEPAQAHQPGSGVRIVRLSQTRGEVQLDRDIARGYEAAFPNLPIVERAKLKTAEGVAEIEFEDSSTLRVTPNSIVEFPLLRRNPDGSTQSTVHVVQGLVFVSMANSKGNEFKVIFGQRQLLLAPSAHMELSVADSASRLAVLDGSVQLQDPSGATTTSISKKHSLFLDPTNSAPPTSIAKMEKTPFDDWDKTAVSYQKQYASSSAYGTSGGSYGISDLNYYGGFVSLPGCGSVWRPYFASASWDPFANGTLAWYGGGAGYSFVSPYPWGWTPYHSGSWQMCNSGGWGWHPQGSGFVGLANTVKAHAPVHSPVRGPGQPLSPLDRPPSLVALNSRPLAVSRLTDAETFTFRQDSAGLGIPRQVMGRLSGLSNTVAHQGTFAASVATSASIAPGRAAAGPSMVSSQRAAGPTAASGMMSASSASHGGAGASSTASSGHR